MYKLGILGVGNMGGAILNGALKNILKEDILLYSPTIWQKEEYKDFNKAKDEKDLVLNSKIILLAIKPQMYEILDFCKDYNFKDKVIISVLAGKTIKDIENNFKDASVIRAMPNTPSKIMEGVTTYSYNFLNESTNEAIDILNKIGKAYMIDESLMHETLPLNGSLPAYAFYFAKAFIDAGVKNNVDYNLSKELVAQTIISSMKLLLKENIDIDTLINNVCSKGGTTIEGLNKLKENEVSNALYECYDACMKRSIELSKKL